jgi:hypothetical protein
MANRIGQVGRHRKGHARHSDGEAMHAILSGRAAMRYWATPPHGKLGQTQARIEAMIAADPAESDDFIVERGGRAIGAAGLWRVPEIGFVETGRAQRTIKVGGEWSEGSPGARTGRHDALTARLRRSHRLSIVRQFLQQRQHLRDVRGRR